MAEVANEASATVTLQQQQQNGSAETAGSPAEAQVGGESAHQEEAAAPPVVTLRLRPRPSVTWGADVINNEGMGKKSSKRCCIFHKKRNFDESDSDESDSDADDEERERRWAQPKPGRPKAHQLYHG
eukprot:g7945.t1